MKKKTITIFSLVLLSLFSTVYFIKNTSYNKSIDTICNIDDLSKISEGIYRKGDYKSDSELIKEIEKSSDWKFEEVYFDDGDRTIYFELEYDKMLIKLGFGGESSYLSKKYEQNFLEVNISENKEIMYWNKSRKNEFIPRDIETSKLDDSKYYTAISNDKLDQFISIYTKAINNTYCKWFYNIYIERIKDKFDYYNIIFLIK